MDSTSVNSRSCSYVAPVSVDLLETVPPSESVSTTSKALMTNAFFMESPESPSASLPEPLLRILWLALVAHLEVEARPLERTRVPDRADSLCLPHVVALLHEDLSHVRVQRVVLVVVIQDYQIPVPLEPSRVDHVAAVDGLDVPSLAGLDVHAVAERARPEPRMHLRAEPGDDAPLRRPRQPATEAAEPDRRPRGRLLRRRDLRQPLLLLGLEVPDEGLEAPRRLGELAHHPLVIRALVAHLREQHATPGPLAVDLGLLARGVRAEARELALARLLPGAAILQIRRRSTILLNQAGVQRGHAREVADGDGAGDRILAAQERRQRAALRVNLVHGPEPPRERLLLAGALRLEVPDLAPQRRDLALGLLDADIELRHLTLLFDEARLDLFELGEERGLARPRVGHAAPLLAQLLLRLLELLLLRLEGIVLPRLAGRRRGERGDEDGGERDPAPGPRHASLRPRASQPPKPPSSVPATMRSAMWCGRRNVRRGTPSVRLASGSRRGARAARASWPSSR